MNKNKIVKRLQGFSLLEMMLALVILATLAQIMFASTAMVSKIAQRSEEIFAAQIQAQNLLTLIAANSASYVSLLEQSPDVCNYFEQTDSAQQRASVDVCLWKKENKLILPQWQYVLLNKL